MKINKFFGKLLVIVFASVLLLNYTVEAKNNENEQGAQKQQTKGPTGQSIDKVRPFDILFGTLWPFKPGTISYETSSDKKILTLNGSCDDTFGVVCWERKVRLKGNSTLEIEILDFGNSSFSDSKMLKVIIWNLPGGAEIPLICKDDMMQSGDPEYVLAVNKGIFQYSLDEAKDEAIYKLAFVFYKAKLEGFKLKARFVE